MTADFLEKYTLLEPEIKRIKRRIEYYQKNPLSSVHGVVKSCTREAPFRETHMIISGSEVKSSEQRENQVQQLLADLSANECVYEDMKLEIEMYIESIEDLEIKSIMKMRYVDGMRFDKIGERLGYDRTSISKKINKYLAEH